MCPSVRPSIMSCNISFTSVVLHAIFEGQQSFIALSPEDRLCCSLAQHLLLTRTGESLEFDDFVRHEIVIRLSSESGILPNMGLHLVSTRLQVAFVRLLVQLTSGRP